MVKSSNVAHPKLVYEIRVQEELDDNLTAWFNPVEVDHSLEDATRLTVSVRDQAELHGLLIKVRDLNLTLISLFNTAFQRNEGQNEID